MPSFLTFHLFYLCTRGDRFNIKSIEQKLKCEDIVQRVSSSPTCTYYFAQFCGCVLYYSVVKNSVCKKKITMWVHITHSINVDITSLVNLSVLFS